MSARFTLYGSPHSLPTYRIALMLRLCRIGFTFRYISFQRGMHLTAEFRALSRWGQVPVIEHDGRVFVQSAAILEYLADTLGCWTLSLTEPSIESGLSPWEGGQRHPILRILFANFSFGFKL